GVLDVPEQPLLIHQSIVPQAPSSLSLRLSVNGQLFSLDTPFKARTEARVRIPRLVPDVLPFRAEVNELEFEAVATIKKNDVNLTARYGSGSSFVTMPDIPH